mmetsp:Transcript_11061/g.21349  ORF Transcript_11061/g.21349 Transcript_11061/m.21349 type:complete len:151 (+) Transcript_11061:134-586(+)
MIKNGIESYTRVLKNTFRPIIRKVEPTANRNRARARDFHGVSGGLKGGGALESNIRSGFDVSFVFRPNNRGSRGLSSDTTFAIFSGNEVQLFERLDRNLHLKDEWAVGELEGILHFRWKPSVDSHCCSDIDLVSCLPLLFIQTRSFRLIR